MDTSGGLLSGFSVLLNVASLLYCLLGTLIGTLIGVLPGIGALATFSILLSLTFGMAPANAIILLAGVYCGAQYGGSTTSILCNIPGEVTSIATCLDGYQMACNGRAGPALGMSAFGSFIGGTLSVIGLMFFAPMIAKFSLRLGPPEYFALIFLGVTMVIYLFTGSIIKGMMMAVAGIACSTIGIDPASGFSRFTFGSSTLMDGLGIGPVGIGMFGIAEVLDNIEIGVKREIFKSKIQNLLPTVKDWIACKWSIVRGTLIGFFIGVLPGGGGALSTFMAYAVEKRVSKHPEKFGTGMIEGVAAPETANNAATGGSMVTLLALGIPSNAVMAIFMAALIIHGIQPGPLFIDQYPALFWGTIASMYIGNIMLLILNLPLIGVWIKILKIPYNILFPLIVVFCFLGVYSLNSNIYEILTMIVFGVFAFIMRKFGFEGTPFLLGLVLGPIMELSFRQSLSYGDPFIFFKRPICGTVMIITLILLITGIIPMVRYGRKELVKIVEEEKES